MQCASNIRGAVRNAHHSHPCWYWLCRWRTDYTIRILSFSLCSSIQQWVVSSENQFCFCSGTFKSLMTPESGDALKCYTNAKAGRSISERINWDRTKVKRVSRRGSKKLTVYSWPDVLVSFSVCFDLVLAQLSPCLGFASINGYYDTLSPDGSV